MAQASGAMAGAELASGPALGPLGEVFPDVRRIAVLRGGGLGDLLFALPAIHALAATYPGARIVLLGSAEHAELLRDRPGPVHEVVVVAEQGRACGEVDRQLGRIDLGVQLHGGGAWSNPFLTSLRPRWTVGSRAAGAAPLSRMLPFRYYQHETLRALEVVGLAGAAPVLLEPRLESTPSDRSAADQALRGLRGPIAAIHPGARDPRRRWPPDRFAEIAAHCLDRDLAVVILGSQSDRDLVADLRSRIGARSPGAGIRQVRALVGAPLPALCGVLARSAIFVGNDSGPRHLARAFGTPTVGIFWIGNVINAGPLGRARDRVLMSWTTACPVCHRDCTDEELPRCPHDVSFVAGVRTADVRRDIDDLLEHR
ncbi:glycosyltransferase family 9 protein [Nocardia implantans]|uniref:Glycosyltransferase family 9 protein n=1 Tax=Nocardia implantans TaxID=3108168 RepID=A0ABU6ATW9_9NOCA|nr:MULTISPECIES: glycosyltransferase family 9 protein [unclassified Nocardia]MEA3532898.1 glycosyltransferase family 9 protein [Nocardia sp. CDC192]MEB3510918.1 glycosyltransferase family 9 protein [Nocardia sp. CDC186]